MMGPATVIVNTTEHLLAGFKCFVCYLIEHPNNPENYFINSWEFWVAFEFFVAT